MRFRFACLVVLALAIATAPLDAQTFIGSIYGSVKDASGQFRTEFYNAWNHTQFSTFDSTARFDANGNQVNLRLREFTAARNPRTIPLALRLRSWR